MKNIIIKFLSISIILTLFHNVYSEEANHSSIYKLLFNDYNIILKKNSWNTTIDGNDFFAYRYNNGYREIIINISSETKNNIVEHKITVTDNKSVSKRSFKFLDSENNPENLRKIILPYLIQIQHEPYKPVPEKMYTASAFIGYHQFHDRYICPRKPEGSLILGFNLVYNPSRFSTLPTEQLATGDYLSFFAYISANSRIREHTYDIHYLLTGTKNRSSNSSDGSIEISGIFMGLEYFRPEANFDDFTWDEDVYEHHPHIQYFVFRTIAWEYIYEKNAGVVQAFNFMAGCGPSVNSSLNATNISEEEEDELSPIFRSNFYGDRRQNFYYSVSVPLKIGLTLSLTNSINVETEWKSYIFFSIEGEDAFDLLNIIRISPAYRLTESLSANFSWEYWHVHSMLENEYKNNHWNRLILAMHYNII